MILVRFLEFSNEEVFVSNLSRILTSIFSTIFLFEKSSPSSFTWFTIFVSLSLYLLIVLVSFIFKTSNSLLRFNSCIVLVLPLPPYSSLGFFRCVICYDVVKYSICHNSLNTSKSLEILCHLLTVIFQLSNSGIGRKNQWFSTLFCNL
uniref:Uncharacterized protein n=1 Tax=Rhizophora mucronata TaxID=61149 RepID=A0A2P2QRV1_RHIMU